MVTNSLYTILVIVDDNSLGSQVANLISSFGYQVQFVANTEGALLTLNQHHVDFVVTTDSCESLAEEGFLDSLRTKNKDAELLLLGDRENYIEALETGALDYVCLPLVDVELQLKIQRAVRECSLRRELAEGGGVDEATGLANKQAFSRTYSREIERTLRQDSALHLVMVSVDGNTDIAPVIEILEESTRDGVDAIFCIKQRQFALILPETNADQATEILQRALLKSLERGLGLGALAIGCALCQREEGRSFSEIERDCLVKAEEAVQKSRQEGGHAAVYSR